MKIKSFKNCRSSFKRNRLPDPSEYYRQQGLKLTGGGEWKSAICPFHNDKNPSLRLRLDSGGFRCMVCGAHGGDVLAFHMQRYKLNFVTAARALGAWED
jgi:DNA primase